METKGDWSVKDRWNVLAGRRLVANCGGYSSSVEGAIEENEANANLICEAVNACKEVNPNEPLKVAQSIKDLVKGCELGLKIAEDIIHDEYDGTSMLDRLLSQLEPIRQALANIGGK